MGSPAPPKRARVQEPAHSQDLPANLQTCSPLLAELEGEALPSSPLGERHTEPQSELLMLTQAGSANIVGGQLHLRRI